MSNGKPKIGIDASNLLQGGGRTHLIELLESADPEIHQFSVIAVFGSKETLFHLRDATWIEKINHPNLEKGRFGRWYWQQFNLHKELIRARCNVLFVPGGSFSGRFQPAVTMCRNMLPFEWKELLRYGISCMTLRLMMLRYTQSKSFRIAAGVIFLSSYAKNKVEKIVVKKIHSALIPHGINNRFFHIPRNQEGIEKFTLERPFRILYVSIIDQYKHQWNIVEAVARLRKKTGWNLVLELVGPAYPPAMNKLKTAIIRNDPDHMWVSYRGATPFKELHKIINFANLGVFASSCENMPNVLLELMASGLPIACSDRGPMSEILCDGGAYFNPENIDDILKSLERLIGDPVLRKRYGQISSEIVQKYTWENCANKTFKYILSFCDVS